MLGIDFIDPLPMTPLGNSMILTVADLFSKRTESFSLPDKRATSVAASLVKLFCNKGIPMAVLSDNGSDFVMSYGYYNTSYPVSKNDYP